MAERVCERENVKNCLGKLIFFSKLNEKPSPFYSELLSSLISIRFVFIRFIFINSSLTFNNVALMSMKSFEMSVEVFKARPLAFACRARLP